MPARKKTILLIEKDAVTFELYRRELCKEFEVLAFQGEQGVLEAVRDHDIRAVIIEPEIRSRQGWKLIPAIRSAARERPLPIIICSVLDARRQTAGQDIAAYLVKPVLPHVLLARVRQVIQQQELLPPRVVMDDSPFLKTPRPSTERYDTHVVNPLVRENQFLSILPDSSEPPSFSGTRDRLPEPFWEDHASAIQCYWRAWELAFRNLRRPTLENGFVSSYCDTAFNGNLFMWDSAFITFFGLYGRRAFNFQGTLDNFYRKQHSDGFICREISCEDGQDAFHRFDPSSTGPNILPWAEWNYYLNTASTDRLETVFPALLAFYQWFRTYRSWPDGSYWSSGWGCGMDNLPRVEEGYHTWWSHGHMSWIDTTLQAILAARHLIRMASVLGREKTVASLKAEVENLARLVNETMWDEGSRFYYDRYAGGSLSRLKHIGAYWALLAGVAPPDRLRRFVAHLENPAEFNRPHRIPALAADDPHYGKTGNYWCGGVWTPTNYMVLKGLDEAGMGALAHEIARNHLANVVAVFESDDTRWQNADQFRRFFGLEDLELEETHTLWENYAPEAPAPGETSKPGYVGWSGLPPIAVLFEDVFGLVPHAPSARLTWNVRLLEGHGVQRYPFGQNGVLDLACARRATAREKPAVMIRSDVPLTLEIRWEGGLETIDVK